MSDACETLRRPSEPVITSVSNLDSLDTLDTLGSYEVVLQHQEDPQSPITRTVFIAVDQSFHSGYAFDWALKNVLKPMTDLVILATVRPAASVPSPYASFITKTIADPSAHHYRNFYSYHQNYQDYTYDDPDLNTASTSYMDFSGFVVNLEEQQRQGCLTLLHNYAEKLKKNKVSCKAIIMRGDARDEIVHKVHELKADVLIMGSRGLGALKRTILGSVSDYCAHNCSVPVVIVKVPSECDGQH